ncbi:IS5 family transposase [Streptomyces mirabilis]|uniref:IS5 family transposase n=1 Tax=Streptomyces mirabilis TaxID=68239 RepID=UPI0034033356
MTDAQSVVRDALPEPAWMEGRGGQPEGYCHRQMLDAVFYVTDNGIEWRAMPVDFPAWDRVYAFFRRWRKQGLAGELHDRLRGRVRTTEGRDREPSAGIIDSQSVKAAASVPAVSRGYDGGKKVNGRRRHVITDSLGLLLMVWVTAADVTDRQAARAMLPVLRTRFRKITLVWADGGYTGCLVTWAKGKLQLTLQIVKRSDDMTGFVVLPRRWLVERSLGWLMRSRRLVRDFEASRFQRGGSAASSPAARASASSTRAITRRSNTASATPSPARIRSASAWRASTAARAAVSRSSSKPITDATGYLPIAENELNVRTLPRRHRHHA